MAEIYSKIMDLYATSAPASKLIADLRRAIIDGQYAPGQRLSEKKVAEDLGVSRNTLREAFQALAEQGLVERIPNRGVSVVAPTMRDIIDIFRMRHFIEPGVLLEADPLHPALVAAESAVEQGQAGIDAEDWRAVGTANMNYHLALMRLSDSPRLVHAFRNLMAVLRLVFLRMNQAEQLHRPFVERNKQILDAIRQESPTQARDLMHEYLTTSEETLLAVYTRRGLE